MRFLYNVVDLVGVVVLVRDFGVSFSFVFGGLCGWVFVSFSQSLILGWRFCLVRLGSSLGGSLVPAVDGPAARAFLGPSTPAAAAAAAAAAGARVAFAAPARFATAAKA